MIPQLRNLTDITIKPYASKTFRDFGDRIEGHIDNIQALRQTIHYILSTERYAYPIYPNNYGVELERLIGKSFPYVQASIGQILRDALTQDDRITNVQVNSVEQTGLNKCHVMFTVFSNIGNIEEVLDFDV